MNGSSPVSSRVLTLPNLISFARIALIPVFVTLIVRPSTTTAGLVMFALVLATDWVDGTIARRTGQVSRLGQILGPVADRVGCVGPAAGRGRHRRGLARLRGRHRGVLHRGMDLHR